MCTEYFSPCLYHGMYLIIAIINLHTDEFLSYHTLASLVAQKVKNLLQCRRYGFSPWVRKIPLEKGMVTHSSILAWRIPWTEGPGGLQFMGLQRFGHNWVTNTFTFLAKPTSTWACKWQRIYAVYFFVFLHQKSYLENKRFLLLRWINEWLIDLIYVTTSLFTHPSFSQSRPSCWLHNNKALKSSSQLLFSFSGTHQQSHTSKPSKKMQR